MSTTQDRAGEMETNGASADTPSEPGWVTLLYDRGHGYWATGGPNLLESLRELVDAYTAGDATRRNQLRNASLRRLNDDSRQALGFLATVGITDDLPLIEKFLTSPDDEIKKAAKVCRFMLTHDQLPDNSPPRREDY